MGKVSKSLARGWTLGRVERAATTHKKVIKAADKHIKDDTGFSPKATKIGLNSHIVATKAKAPVALGGSAVAGYSVGSNRNKKGRNKRGKTNMS